MILVSFSLPKFCCAVIFSDCSFQKKNCRLFALPFACFNMTYITFYYYWLTWVNWIMTFINPHRLFLYYGVDTLNVELITTILPLPPKSFFPSTISKLWKLCFMGLFSLPVTFCLFSFHVSVSPLPHTPGSPTHLSYPLRRQSIPPSQLPPLTLTSQIWYVPGFLSPLFCDGRNSSFWPTIRVRETQWPQLCHLSLHRTATNSVFYKIRPKKWCYFSVTSIPSS